VHLVVVLLGVLALFLYLTQSVAKDPEKRYYFYLYVLIDLWLGSVFLYLVVNAVLN
jgi:bacteriorhodopsin